MTSFKSYLFLGTLLQVTHTCNAHTRRKDHHKLSKCCFIDNPTCQPFVVFQTIQTTVVHTEESHSFLGPTTTRWGKHLNNVQSEKIS